MDDSTQPESSKLTIWVDADACPTQIRDVLYRAAKRNAVPVVLVANSPMRLPMNAPVSLQLVPSGADVADNYIAEHCQEKDLVITADIPLADRIVDKGAFGLNPRGELYTKENIKERLSMRDFMEEMRFAGLAQGGPASHSQGDTQQFANALDRFLTRALRS